ncbi:MAG: hypothetical protein AB7G75_24235 [Candidatus Binatia bacterium]
MIANHIHDALAQVRELQQRILERQRFRGYSGNARIFAGTLAFVAAWVMASESFPRTYLAHLLGWGTVCVVSAVVNYGALLYWFVREAGLRGDLRELRPAVDAFPPFIVGGVLTLTMLLDDHYDALFGIWMCLFGLANIASRHVLPPRIVWVGSFYVLCGMICLLSPTRSFLNPWPMGVVFFIGEWAGGMLLALDQKARPSHAPQRSAAGLEKESYGDET